MTDYFKVIEVPVVFQLQHYCIHVFMCVGYVCMCNVCSGTVAGSGCYPHYQSLTLLPDFIATQYDRYWHNNVVSPSVGLSATLCTVAKRYTLRKSVQTSE